MSILIRDETANATVLTIDNNGNMAFADGTPINMLTLNGYGIIDSDGYIVHGFGSNSVQPNYGQVTCGYGQSVDIATGISRMPTTVVDTTYPAKSYWVDPAGGPHIDMMWGMPLHVVIPDVGLFTIFNSNQATEDFMANPTFARLPNQNATVNYRSI
jgi:hypothetical protein